MHSTGLTYAWIGGWAVPVDYMRAAVEQRFPGSAHHIYTPRVDALEQVSQGGFDVVVGYSLGSLLVLHSIELIPPAAAVYLLAPIFNFQQEAQLGSRVSKVQLKYLLRWLQRDPHAAIEDFYRTAGLNVQLERALPYPIEDLVWGLETLLNVQVSLQAARNCTCVIGQQDTLLDTEFYRKNLKSHVRVVNGGHDIRSLLSCSAVT